MSAFFMPAIWELWNRAAIVDLAPKQFLVEIAAQGLFKLRPANAAFAIKLLMRDGEYFHGLLVRKSGKFHLLTDKVDIVNMP